MIPQGSGLDPHSYALTLLRRGAYYITLADFANSTPFSGLVLFRMTATDATKARQLVSNYNTSTESGFEVEIDTSARMRIFIVKPAATRTGSSTAASMTVSASTAIQGFGFDYDGTTLRTTLNKSTLATVTPAGGGYVPAVTRPLTYGINSTGAANSQCDAIEWLGYATATAVQSQAQWDSAFDRVKAAIDIVPLAASPALLFSVKQSMTDIVAKPVFSDIGGGLDLVLAGGSGFNLPAARPEVSEAGAPTWGW